MNPHAVFALYSLACAAVGAGWVAFRLHLKQPMQPSSAPATKAFPCGCCSEPVTDTPMSYGDPDLGRICSECADGLINGRYSFRKVGVLGIHRGPCPDNDGPPKSDAETQPQNS
ncbi:MAG: hypothetical protein QM755_23835 [Luteolibacter sp.]